MKNNIDTIVIAVGGQGIRISDDLKKRGVVTSKIFLSINNKPLLSHLIDMALDLNFQRIFLLSSYYESELRVYLEENYLNNDRIIPIFGGKVGRKLGVPWLLYSIRQKLREPFIYSDGNIFYNQRILKKIKDVESLGVARASVVLSAKDLAPTHSCVILRKERIYDISTRLLLRKGRSNHDDGKQYCSIGLMVLSEFIFSSVPRFAYRKDMD